MVPQTAPEPPSPWSVLLTKARRRLVVLCGCTFASVQYHPAILEHMCVLIQATALSDEACAMRGGCDPLIELWTALEETCPLVFLEAPCSTRRLRKQLLHKLSKNSLASSYSWEALSGPDGPFGGSSPALEEGWAEVHWTSSLEIIRLT